MIFMPDIQKKPHSSQKKKKHLKPHVLTLGDTLGNHSLLCEHHGKGGSIASTMEAAMNSTSQEHSQTAIIAHHERILIP